MLIKITCTELDKVVEFDCNDVKFQSNTFATNLPKFYNGASFYMSRENFLKILDDIESILGSDIILEIADWHVKINYHDTKCIFNDVYFYIFGEESTWI